MQKQGYIQRVIMNGLTSGFRSNDLDYLSTDDRLRGNDKLSMISGVFLEPASWGNFSLILLRFIIKDSNF